jgi:iron(II)-dependent oxidoreductase
VTSLVESLQAAREHTRRVADDLRGERELGPMLAIVNPPRWEVGHVGWFQEFWCLRGGSEERASILPNADALYNSATVPHDARWSVPLPSFADTIAYRDEVLERVLRKLDGLDPYFIELAVRHELMHAEAFHYTRQTLGYPGLPERPRPLAEGGDMECAGGVFRLGATPGEHFAFDNEKWSHPVVLEPFRIARQPVTYGEYRRFAEPPQSRDGMVRRFDRWIPIPEDEPVRHVS